MGWERLTRGGLGRPTDSGAAAVEFALLLPIVLALIAAVLALTHVALPFLAKDLLPGMGEHATSYAASFGAGLGS